MARLRLFARARESAGCARDEIDAETLGQLLEVAARRYGGDFVAVLGRSRVWVNGDEPPAGEGTPLRPDDEVAVLPPVSGGAEALGADRKASTGSSPERPGAATGRRAAGAVRIASGTGAARVGSVMV